MLLFLPWWLSNKLSSTHTSVSVCAHSRTHACVHTLPVGLLSAFASSSVLSVQCLSMPVAGQHTHSVGHTCVYVSYAFWIVSRSACVFIAHPPGESVHWFWVFRVICPSPPFLVMLRWKHVDRFLHSAPSSNPVGGIRHPKPHGRQQPKPRPDCKDGGAGSGRCIPA